MTTNAPIVTRSDRLRRVVSLCFSFARNLAYYRAGQDTAAAPLLAPSHPHASLWRQANANFLDVAVLEWAKLLGDRKGEHYWRNIVACSDAFETALLARLGMSNEGYADHERRMRHYRDKFVAHLDSDLVMNVPTLLDAQAAVWFYLEHVVLHEDAAGDLRQIIDAPDKLAQGYAQCFKEAGEVYRRAARFAL